jgi:hypothetical protein
MLARGFPSVVLAGLLALWLPSAAAQDSKPPTIREFPIATIEALGKQLHRQDAMAATAFDTLFEMYPEAKKLQIRAWITESNAENQRIFIIQEKDSKQSLAYIINFPKDGQPAVEAHLDEPLPPFVQTRLAARASAIEAIPALMAERYNFEVLDDPDGNGFLVYGLAATMKPDEIVVGGHFRVSVSADGSKAEQVDALSRSLLILPKTPTDLPEGSKTAAATMTHIVSSTPVETHVYASLLHKTPFFVATSEKDLWVVGNGKIEKMDMPKK